MARDAVKSGKRAPNFCLRRKHIPCTDTAFRLSYLLSGLLSVRQQLNV